MGRANGFSRCQAIGLVALLGGTALAEGVTPSPSELEALASLKGRLAGLVVWESNRTGSWELYAMNADGTGACQLTQLAGAEGSTYKAYLRPQISPDGSTVLFAYGPRDSAPECWLVPIEGGQARRLCAGLPLNWSLDGKLVYLLRGFVVWGCDPATGQEQAVSEVKTPVEGKSGGTVGAISPSLELVALRTLRAVEVFSLAEGKTVKGLGGCEPRFSADGRVVYWVHDGSDFRAWEVETGVESQLPGPLGVEPYTYAYFPTVSADGRWIVYAASPGQHDHETSDYEVFVQELADWKPSGSAVRLTFDGHTDRWPNLWVDPSGVGNPLPDGPYDGGG